ncbi:MAG: alpha/beta hydrolase [Candidatus Bathyarchaeota archaeon]|nr:MAG: alpha/beta hydrolase [Candidatus Bathyarchaeota archaeon]
MKTNGESPAAKRAEVEGHSVSYFSQRRGPESIVFVHGYGASKDTFLEAFGIQGFQSFSMLATDLIGFGDSGKPSNFSYLLREQAEILKKAIDLVGFDRFHLVAHSMGGIIGIELGEIIPNRLRSFINVEGNITAEDCTMSKRVAKMGERYFAQEGFEELKHSISAEAEKAQSTPLKEYVASLSKATPESLYRSSVSTVFESCHGDLLTRFARLPLNKCYIYGEKNRGLFPAESMLRREEIPLFYVSNGGHSMMKENPKEFYNLILMIIRQSSS